MRDATMTDLTAVAPRATVQATMKAEKIEPSWYNAAYGSEYPMYDAHETSNSWRFWLAVSRQSKSKKVRTRAMSHAASLRLGRALKVPAIQRNRYHRGDRISAIVADYPNGAKSEAQDWLRHRDDLTPSLAAECRLIHNVDQIIADENAKKAEHDAANLRAIADDVAAHTAIRKLGEIRFADDQRLMWDTATGTLKNPSGNKYHCSRYHITSLSGVVITGEYDRHEGWFVYTIGGLASQPGFAAREALCARIAKLFARNHQHMS